MNDETAYLTQEGFDKLAEELDQLREVRRAEVAEMIRDAKEDGDLRENAAYDEAKEQQAFVEGRIIHLEDLLKRAEVIQSPNGTDAVALGSVVTVVEDGGEPEQFRIVGSAEANPAKGLISNASPLGRALLGKTVGDAATYATPVGDTLTFMVTAID